MCSSDLDGCRAPDWFFVPGVPRLLDGILRLSYVMWQEGVSPLIVIEYVSGNGAEERDRTPHTGKFWVYEQAIRAAYYAIWDNREEHLELYELVKGRYQPVSPTKRGRFPIPAMQIELGIWDGQYQGNPGPWLRAWDRQGLLLPTPEERADAQQQRADAEQQRADALAARLRELGVDPDRL